jgi:hypothetical protein
LVVLGVAVSVYLLGQARLRSRALDPNEPDREAAGIEPFGWTRQYGSLWASAGRFLRAHARAGESLAAGAAGAAPYYSELPNVDLLGLNDRETARFGLLSGGRPGHRRLATREYVLSRRPTYFLVAECQWPWGADHGAADGYVCVETTFASMFGGDGRVTFLVDAARGEELVAEGVVKQSGLR